MIKLDFYLPPYEITHGGYCQFTVCCKIRELSLPFVDSSKIASIGWCFGGGQSLQLALNSQNHPPSRYDSVLVVTPLITDSSATFKN